MPSFLKRFSKTKTNQNPVITETSQDPVHDSNAYADQCTAEPVDYGSCPRHDEEYVIAYDSDYAQTSPLNVASELNTTCAGREPVSDLQMLGNMPNPLSWHGASPAQLQELTTHATAELSAQQDAEQIKAVSAVPVMTHTAKPSVSNNARYGLSQILGLKKRPADAREKKASRLLMKKNASNSERNQNLASYIPQLLKNSESSETSPLTETKRINLWAEDFKSHRFNLLMGLSGMGLALISLGAYINKASESTLVPYIVAVDQHGVVRNQGLVTDYAGSVSTEMIFNQLCGFITNMRLISTDKDVQHKAVVKAYAFVKEGTQPASVLNEFYQSRDAFNQSYKREISVTIANVMAVDPNTIEIEWVEHLSIDHHERDSLRLRARMSYKLGSYTSKNPEAVLLNPLNLVITDLRISEALM